MRTALIWSGLALLACGPLILATQSPLLQWRDPMYIISGFAGIIGLALMLVQPLLAARVFRGVSPRTSRNLHRFIGICLLLAVTVHVGGLWITSPPDVVDVLLFRSPTPFGIWGVLAMWALILAAAFTCLNALIAVPHARVVHAGLAICAVFSTALHAVLIEGAMEAISKYLLSGTALAACGLAVVRLRLWRRL